MHEGRLLNIQAANKKANRGPMAVLMQTCGEEMSLTEVCGTLRWAV